MNHKKVVCRNCGEVVMQCRCPYNHHVIEYVAECKRCNGKPTKIDHRKLDDAVACAHRGETRYGFNFDYWHELTTERGSSPEHVWDWYTGLDPMVVKARWEKLGKEKNMITDKEFREKYESYKRGFIDGASGKPITAQIGTPEPKYREDYNEGFEKGRGSFSYSMNAKAHQLRMLGVSKTLTESEFMELYAPQAKEWDCIKDELIRMAKLEGKDGVTPYEVSEEQRRRAREEGRLLIEMRDFDIVADKKEDLHGRAEAGGSHRAGAPLRGGAARTERFREGSEDHVWFHYVHD